MSPGLYLYMNTELKNTDMCPCVKLYANPRPQGSICVGTMYDANATAVDLEFSEIKKIGAVITSELQLKHSLD